jgi:hypothetical protein
MPFLVLALTILLIRLLPQLVKLGLLRWKARKGGSQMITLKLPAAPIVVRKSLCAACAFSHVVRGYEKHEELILCGYSFPPREILFPVRECTDFRAEREMQLALAAAPET